MNEIKERGTMDAAYEAALTWANDVRAQRGEPKLKRLPKGEIGSAVDCPLARATGFAIAGHQIWLGWGPDRHIADLPPSVWQFVYRFDAKGSYPELIGPPEPLELVEEVSDTYPAEKVPVA